MSFSVDWLATRRLADHRSRNADIAARLKHHFEDRASVRVLDLGCGTGSNMAATSKLLPNNQHWTLVDNDLALLHRIEPVNNIPFETQQADLAHDLDALFNQQFDLVTASALFDLAGSTFTHELVRRTSEISAAFFTVLTYDGHEGWLPAHKYDAQVLAAFHADQHTDKGLGPALGPEATKFLASAFTEAGYETQVGKSDWHLSDAKDTALIRMLADGIHAATAPVLGDTAVSWHEERVKASSVRIGHLDLIALPPKAR